MAYIVMGLYGYGPYGRDLRGLGAVCDGPRYALDAEGIAVEEKRSVGPVDDDLPTAGLRVQRQ